jgi:hypothetical protein
LIGAERVGVAIQTIGNWMEDFTKLSEANNLVNLSKEENAAAFYMTDFTPPPPRRQRVALAAGHGGVRRGSKFQIRAPELEKMTNMGKEASETLVFKVGLACRSAPVWRMVRILEESGL